MAFDPNPLFYEMCSIFQNNYSEENKVVICNEGGTRSSKTWDTFHFIYAFCDHNRNQENDIYILRDTLTNCRDKTFKDFKKCMKVIGADLKYTAAGQKPYVNIFGNHVHFLGLDSEDNTEGYPSDIIFINETLETQKDKVAGLMMRCRKLIIMDWNPKFTHHWCFNLEGQRNVFFTRTNYKNNKHLQKSIVTDIEGYEPWESGSYYIENHKVMYLGKLVDDDNQPPPHPANVRSDGKGTADEFRWKVYGLGLRGAMKGLLFPNVTWIDEFPDIAHTIGLDYGFRVDPSAIVKYARRGRNVYLELLWYAPTESSREADIALKKSGIRKSDVITADSSDRHVSEKKGVVQMTRDLFALGWYNISKVSKTKGLMFWLGDLGDYTIHIVNNQSTKHSRKMYQAAKTEQENYRIQEVNGIPVEEPVDKFNHFWDACFIGDTPITTINGEIDIKHIKIGDIVLTSKGYNTVVNKFNNGIKEISSFCLQFDTFSLSLQCTSNHKVKTDKGWTEISKLEQGQMVYITKCLTGKSINSTRENDTTATNHEKCIGMSGSSVTAHESTDTTSITLMETPLTIILRTLSKSKGVNTFLDISSNGLRKIQNGLRHSIQKALKPLKIGTRAKRVLSGIVSMRSGVDLVILRLERFNALNAKLHSPDKQLNMSFAHLNAKPNTEGIQVSTMKSEHANTVVRNGHVTDTQEQSVVTKCVLARIDSSDTRMEQVYDIEVENEHEYFANGLLVHNCRYAHMAHGQEL